MTIPLHDLSKLHKAVIEGDVPAAVAAARDALDDGVQPVDLISQGIGPACWRTEAEPQLRELGDTRTNKAKPRLTETSR